METKTNIVIEPKWAGTLPLLLAALENGTEEGKRIAREELAHMAQVAGAVTELRAALRKLSNECDGDALGTVKAPTWETLCEVETLLNRIKG